MQNLITRLSFEVELCSPTFFLIILCGKTIRQQLTDRNGVALFDTNYPGWYRGRATHIHVKVHIEATLTAFDGAIYAKDGHVSHTGQLYFDDALTDKIATVFPYSANNLRRTRNNEDGIYNQENGGTMILPIQFLTNELMGAMKAEVTLGIDPTATPALLDNIPRSGRLA